MKLDPDAAVRHLRRTDPIMRDLIDTVGPLGLRPGARGDHFTTLARAIVGQQLSGKAAETIWGRFVALFPDARKLRPEDVLGLDDEALRAVGLSGAKSRSVQDLAAKVASGELRLDRLGRYDDEKVVTELVTVRGIGRWTAEMFLMFKLGRADVWPVGDLGIRNAVARLYSVHEAAELVTVADPWRPWRSAAAWYLWRSLDVPTV